MQKEYFTGADDAFKKANDCIIAIAALESGEWDNSALVAVGPLAPTNAERIAQVKAYYLSRKPLDVSAGPNWDKRNDSPHD